MMSSWHRCPNRMAISDLKDPALRAYYGERVMRVHNTHDQWSVLGYPNTIYGDYEFALSVTRDLYRNDQLEREQAKAVETYGDF